MTAPDLLRRIGTTAVVFAAVVTHAGATDRPAPGTKAARPASVRIELLADANHRAIFCGRDGTETSAAYARVLARDIKRLQATGHTTAQALATIEDKAC